MKKLLIFLMSSLFCISVFGEPEIYCPRVIYCPTNMPSECLVPLPWGNAGSQEAWPNGDVTLKFITAFALRPHANKDCFYRGAGTNQNLTIYYPGVVLLPDLLKAGNRWYGSQQDGYTCSALLYPSLCSFKY